MINNRYLSNVLGLGLGLSGNQELGQQVGLKQNEAIEEEEEVEFNVRKYLDDECEKMLKEIQKGNMNQFLQIFQDYPDNVQE